MRQMAEMTGKSETAVDVCVCTFRRPYLANTLRSLAEQTLPDGVHFKITVADNDIEQSARPAVLDAASKFGIPIDYIHAPARNISVARNACLDYAKKDWIAFVDDDETVSAHWIASLLQASQNADVVFGPVNAIYNETTPDWILRGNFHTTRAVFDRGRIRTGYTGNVLIRRRALEKAGARFDLASGAAGGEDTLFFGRLSDAGLRLSYAPEAVAVEPVPLERQALGWLIRRAFRTGRSHALMLSQRGGSPRAIRTAVSASKATICWLAGLGNIWSAFGWRKWLIRGSMHAGMTVQFLGF